MTKETYIQEFGYIIHENDEILMRLMIKTSYFMKILSVDELPDYTWN